MSAAASLALPVLLGTINLLVVCGNLSVLYILVSQKSLHTSTNAIVFSLTLADFLLGCLILPFSIVQEFSNSWSFGTLWCKSWLSLDILLSTASIYNLLAISFDRYMAVKQPIKYGRLISSSRLTKVTISAVWLISGALALPPFLSDLFFVTTSRKEMDDLLLEGNYSDEILGYVDTCTPITNSDLYILFSATISFILPMILMVGLNASIFCTVLDSKRKLSQSPFPARSASMGGKQEEVGRILRVHRGGSSRNPISVAVDCGPPTKEHILATARSRRALSIVKKGSMGYSNYASINSNNNHGVKSHSFAAILSTSLDRQSLPSSRKGTMESYITMNVGTSPRETFSCSLDSPISAGSANGTAAAVAGTATTEQRRQSLRQIWVNRIRRIKMGQSKKCSYHSMVSLPLPSTFIGSEANIVNMKKLLEQEATIRSMAAVRQPSIIERTAHRSVWLPAVVTTLFAGTRQRSNTLCRRQSERLLLYPTLHFAKNSLRTELRVARTIAVVVGCFTCCWLPFTLIYVLQAFHLCPVGQCIPEWLFTTAFWLGYANSALNPLLYAAFSRDFRLAFRRLLMRDRHSSFRSSA